MLVDIERAKKERVKHNYKNKYERMASEISDSFEALRFIQSREIRSYDHLNGLYKASFENYNNTLNDFFNAENAISQLEFIASLPDLINDLEKKIAGFSDDMDYQMESMSFDKNKLSKYKALALKHNVSDVNKTELTNKFFDAKNKLSVFKMQLSLCNNELSSFEQCLKNLDRIDRKNNMRNESAVKQFHITRKVGRSNESNIIERFKGDRD